MATERRGIGNLHATCSCKKQYCEAESKRLRKDAIWHEDHQRQKKRGKNQKMKKQSMELKIAIIAKSIHLLVCILSTPICDNLECAKGEKHEGHMLS
jgi:uncharacterized protein (DUF2344 family)